MQRPKTVLYAIGTGGKIETATVYGETVEEFATALQLAVNQQAQQRREEPQTVYVWEPGKDNVIDLSALRRLKP